MRALVVLVVIGASFLPPVASVAGDECREFEGVGFACPTEGGLRVALADGTFAVSHGFDPVPRFPFPAVSYAPRAASCADDLRDYRAELVYARAADRPDRANALRAGIVDVALRANGALDSEAARFGLSMTFRMLCDAAGNPVVREAVLPTRASAATTASIRNDLSLLGFNDNRVKYWIWYDGTVNCGGCGGWGWYVEDDQGSPNNGNNRGPSYGITFGYLGEDGAFIMLHEAGHTLGAVQNTAPRSSGAMHCNDGYDVMCYSDGGSRSAYGVVCATRTWFDCNHDDYFNANPPPGSFVATKWNLASPMNRFIAGCFRASGALVGGANGAGGEILGVNAADHAIPAPCAGHRFSVNGANQDNFNVCWYAGTSLLRCDAKAGPESGEVPAGATRARVLYHLGAGGTYTLSIV